MQVMLYSDDIFQPTLPKIRLFCYTFQKAYISLLREAIQKPLVKIDGLSMMVGKYFNIG